jgi:AmmeMemoRadiSam system protein B/AmmeMemoRadiSam system protein A
MFQRTLNLFLFLMILSVSCFAADNVKQCEFAGSWYSGDKDTLSRDIDDYLKKADLPKIDGEILGVICPHAGYAFSAPLAAYSYKLLTGRKYDAVILLGSTHKYYFSGATVYNKGGFQIPLGELNVDSDIAAELLKVEGVQANFDYFKGEHSLEMQMPFLYKVLPNTPIVPVLFGDVKFDFIERMAAKLVDISAKKNILIVVSSDMSHYHPYDEANVLDLDTIDLIGQLRAAKLWTTRNVGEGRACGIAGIGVFLEYLNLRHARIEVLKHLNSGDTSGDKTKVVGYLSAAGMISNGPAAKEEAMNEFSLNGEEKKKLLEIARETLETYIRDKKIPKYKITDANICQGRGAFVTLTKNGDLRGCIGRMAADEPLYQVISEMAIQAAVEDPRFPPVRENELKDITIEISVLTPMKPLKSLDDIVVGRDGLLLRKGFNQGVFLPQVPGEQGWDKKAYLENLCYKAGLSDKNAYMDSDAKLSSFQAIVFNETEYK